MAVVYLRPTANGGATGLTSGASANNLGNTYLSDNARANFYTPSSPSTGSSYAYLDDWVECNSDGTNLVGGRTPEEIFGAAQSIEAIEVRWEGYYSTGQGNLWATFYDGTSVQGSQSYMASIVLGNGSGNENVAAWDYVTQGGTLPGPDDLAQLGVSGTWRIRAGINKSVSAIRNSYMDVLVLKVTYTPAFVILTSPKRYSVFQRPLPSGSRNVKISGEAGVGGTNLEARFVGESSWTTVISGAYSAGATFTDVAIPASQFRRNIQFRENGGAVQMTFETAVGDIWLLIGQSNCCCLGGYTLPNDDPESYGGSGFWVGQFFKETAGIHEWNRYLGPTQPAPYQSTGDPSYLAAQNQDSCWPAVFGWISKRTGVPQGFIPVARSQTGIGCWDKGRNTSAAIGSNPPETTPNWTTAPDPNTLFEEIIQRVQQLRNLETSTPTGSSPDYYGTVPSTLHGMIRGVLIYGGEANAISGTLSTPTDGTAWDNDCMMVVDDLVEALNPELFLVGQLGKYVATLNSSQLNVLTQIRLRQAALWADTTGNRAKVKRGPVTYDLDVTAAGDSEQVHFNTTDGTLTNFAHRWTIALYDAAYGSDPEEHRHPQVSAFRVTGASSAEIDFGETINDSGFTLWEGVRCYLNGSLLTPTASTPTSGQRRITRSGTRLLIELYSGVNLLGVDVLTLDLGYRNESSYGPTGTPKSEMPEFTRTFVDGA